MYNFLQVLTWQSRIPKSPFDFEGPARDGYAVDWPIRYKDLADWYSYVERFVGVSGNKDGLDILPDGDFLKPWESNVVEDYFSQQVKKHYIMFQRLSNKQEREALLRKRRKTNTGYARQTR